MRSLFDAYLLRLRAPRQRLATWAIRAVSRRWVFLAWLLGLAPENSGVTNAGDETPYLENLERLKNAGDFSDRARAARALGSVRRPEVTSALIAALRDSSSEVGAQAAETLGQHGGDDAVSGLVEVVTNRQEYFCALTRASAVRALGFLLPAGRSEPLARAVTDVDVAVSLAAIAALAERDESASVEALVKVLENPRGFYLPLTRQAAARALVSLEHFDGDERRRLLDAESDETVRQELELAGPTRGGGATTGTSSHHALE